MCLVFFDFDRTLTARDTIFPLGLRLARMGPENGRKTARLAWALFLLKSRILSNHQFKERFCRVLLKGHLEQDVRALSRSFADDHVAPQLNRKMVETLFEHRGRGDEVYIVSSNFRFLLEAMSGHLDINGVIATEAETANGRFTGRLAGFACSGPEKLSRVLARFDTERVKNAVAYGDSADDGSLLQFVKTAVWV